MATGVLIAGIALQVNGQIQADKAQAKAERQNKQFFNIQKAQAAAATRRAADIFEDESEFFIGEQISSYARAGVDITGSALLHIAGTKGSQGREKAAIVREGRTTTALAGMRANQADSNADRLSSDSLRNLTLAIGAFNAGSAVLQTNNPSPVTNNNYFLSAE